MYVRLRPWRSARDAAGSSTVASAMAYASSTHWDASKDPPRSALISGSATVTAEMSMTSMKLASNTRTSVLRADAGPRRPRATRRARPAISGRGNTGSPRYRLGRCAGAGSGDERGADGAS